MTMFSEYLAALDVVAAATAATRRVASQVDFNSLLPGQQVRLVGLSWASVGMRGDVVTIDASSDEGPTFSHGANGWVIYYANEGDDWGAVPVEEVTLTAKCITTEEGVVFEPFAENGTIGYLITAPDGRTERIFLSPSTSHDVNPDTPHLADTFVYVSGDAEEDATFYAHFPTERSTEHE